MTTNGWIGVVLVILVIIFFMVAFFVGGDMDENKFVIMKYLGAFCAGIGGGLLILGQAEVKLQNSVGPATYVISGTSGVALFLVVWFFFPQYQNVVHPPSTLNSVKAVIEKPRKDDTVSRSFECSGTVRGLSADLHLWLAVEVNGLIWIKEGEIKPDSNNRWAHTVYEDGAPPTFSLSLWVANDDANKFINAWFQKGKMTGQYPELKDIDGTLRVGRVDDLRITP